ncbi:MULTISPECIES: hypothetical protein [unclassified Streptomyces]|uniref:hypothetical protein n=1 Tax=unclassified Streptomyces TaxID=2593676 RepID=UPI00332F8AAE
MERFVHKQVTSAGIVVSAGLIGLAVSAAVNGPVRLPGWWFLAALVGWAALWGVISTTGLLQGGDVALFRAAVPVADPAAVSARAAGPWRRARSLAAAFGVWTVVAAALAFVAPLAPVFHFFWAVDPLLRAERAARWERGRNVLLWEGTDEASRPTAPVGRPSSRPSAPTRRPSVFTTPRPRGPILGETPGADLSG